MSSTQIQRKLFVRDGKSDSSMKRKEYHIFCSKVLVVSFILLVSLASLGQPKARKPLYSDPNQPIDKRVKDLIRRMTLKEKTSQMGHIPPAIKRLGIPAYNWSNECVHGVMAENVTVFPQAIGLASTWNPHLIYEVATAISDEARALANKEENRRFLTFWFGNTCFYISTR